MASAPYINIKKFDKYMDDAEKVLKQLMNHGSAETKNTLLPRYFGMKAKNVMNLNMIDYAVTNYNRKENKAIFKIQPGIKIKPIGFKWYFKRLKI